MLDLQLVGRVALLGQLRDEVGPLRPGVRDGRLSVRRSGFGGAPGLLGLRGRRLLVGDLLVGLRLRGARRGQARLDGLHAEVDIGPDVLHGDGGVGEVPDRLTRQEGGQGVERPRIALLVRLSDDTAQVLTRRGDIRRGVGDGLLRRLRVRGRVFEVVGGDEVVLIGRLGRPPSRLEVDVELTELGLEVGDGRGCAALGRLGLVDVILRHIVGQSSGAHSRGERQGQGESGQGRAEALPCQLGEAHGTARPLRAMGQAHKVSVMSRRVALVDALLNQWTQ